MPRTLTNFTFTKRFTFINLFAGLGEIRLGFENVGCKCVFLRKWDKDESYEANFREIPRGRNKSKAWRGKFATLGDEVLNSKESIFNILKDTNA